MNEITKELQKVNPDILIYGEGWAADKVALGEEQIAQKSAAKKMPGIAMFNDNIRDAIKGHVFYKKEKGFVNGKEGMEEDVKFSVVGATKHSQANKGKEKDWAKSAAQSINYISAHDDLTLWDKLSTTNPDDEVEVRKDMNRLAAAIVFTSQGIPFIQAGEEMLRTKPSKDPKKKFISNSYNSSDEVNSIKWTWKKTHKDIVEYYKGLIAFRKEHSALRMIEPEEIQKHLQFVEAPANVVAYTISRPDERESLDELCIIYNANRKETEVTIPAGEWDIYVNETQAGTIKLAGQKGGTIKVSPLSALVLGRSLEK